MLKGLFTEEGFAEFSKVSDRIHLIFQDDSFIVGFPSEECFVPSSNALSPGLCDLHCPKEVQVSQWFTDQNSVFKVVGA